MSRDDVMAAVALMALTLSVTHAVLAWCAHVRRERRERALGAAVDAHLDSFIRAGAPPFDLAAPKTSRPPSDGVQP